MRERLEWTIGKTAASISFVREAEKAIEKLQTVIEEVKSGKRVMSEWTGLTDIIYDR